MKGAKIVILTDLLLIAIVRKQKKVVTLQSL